MRNRGLTELDLTANRVGLDAFRQLLRGIVRNRKLKTIRVRVWTRHFRVPVTSGYTLNIYGYHRICYNFAVVIIFLTQNFATVNGHVSIYLHCIVCWFRTDHTLCSLIYYIYMSPFVSTWMTLRLLHYSVSQGWCEPHHDRRRYGYITICLCIRLQPYVDRYDGKTYSIC